MKKNSKDFYSLTQSDVNCIRDLLPILYSVELDGVSEAQMILNAGYCESVILKFASGVNDFDGNEIKVIFVSLQLASMVLSGDIDCGDDIYQTCAKYRFEINRLEPVFSKIYYQHSM